MDFTYLASFVAVAEELHFSRAAARRHLSQPALSKQVQQLERVTGLTLFVRTALQTVRLTPEGMALLPRAKAAILAAGEVQEQPGTVAARRDWAYSRGLHTVCAARCAPGTPATVPPTVPGCRNRSPRSQQPCPVARLTAGLAGRRTSPSSAPAIARPAVATICLASRLWWRCRGTTHSRGGSGFRAPCARPRALRTGR